MEFKPCIDIHNGVVKQIVGGSLSDIGDKASENYSSSHDADYYAEIYKKNNLPGGHVIILNGKESPYYEASLSQAKKALLAYPDGLLIGGGVTDDNAASFIEMGASKVIVTSYVFQNGEVRKDRIESLVRKVGREHLCLDLSCRISGNKYYIVTDRWQKYTSVLVERDTLKYFAEYASELLVHAVDVEGKSGGVDERLLDILSQCDDVPITYAGGVKDLSDIEKIFRFGKGNISVTVGSSLDLFGGKLSIEEIVSKIESLK